MPKVCVKYVYFKCISCDKTRYKKPHVYEKMLQKQTAEEIDATFKCMPCKHLERKAVETREQ